MAQHDYVIDNSTGANVRADINNVLQAIATNNSGSSTPSTTLASQFFADTNAGIMKLRNTANNGYVNLFNLAGGINVDANSNFSADVAFDGTGDQNITFDKSESSFVFNDNAKAVFGTGSDLAIFHSGSHSFIADQGTGNLIIKTNQIQIENSAGNESFLIATENDSVQLFYDNTRKLETRANGIRIPDDTKINFGDSDDYHLRFQNGTGAFIEAGGNSLFIRSNNIELGDNSGNKYLQGIDGDATVLYFNGSERAKTGNNFNFFLDNSGGTAGKGRLGFGSSGVPFIEGLDTGNHGSGSKMEFFDGDGDTFIQCLRNSIVKLYADGADQFFTNSFGLQMKNDKKILFKKETSTSGSVTCVDFDKDNPTNNVGDISMTNSAVTYNTGSDYRLKENERPIDDAIEKVKLLKPYYFNFIETPEILSQGFYAHEVSDIVPTAVKGEKDQVALNGMPIYQKLDHSKIVPMLAAGLKALIEKVEKLEAA